MRYVIYGAGAIGGGIGGCLAASGADVVLVARGAHLEALRAAGGIRLQRDDHVQLVEVPAVGRVSDAGLRAGDVVILTVKSQHTAGAIDELRALDEADLAVVCAQNGTDNERQALRCFARVYGLCVLMPATHLEAGVVELRDGPMPGLLDLGRYPAGVDDVAERIASDLRTAGFASEVHPAIMTRKYRKLLSNLGNSLDAAAGSSGRHSFLLAMARDEAGDVLARSGIEVSTEEEDRSRRQVLPAVPAPRRPRRSGSSSWQSLARGSTSIEADFLNGEIVLLGRLAGVPTPVNEYLAGLAVSLVRRGAPPASMTIEEIEAGAAKAGISPPD